MVIFKFGLVHLYFGRSPDGEVTETMPRNTSSVTICKRLQKGTNQQLDSISRILPPLYALRNRHCFRILSISLLPSNLGLWQHLRHTISSSTVHSNKEEG